MVAPVYLLIEREQSLALADGKFRGIAGEEFATPNLFELLKLLEFAPVRSVA